MPFWKLILASTKYRWVIGVIEQYEAGKVALSNGQSVPIVARSIASVAGRKVDLTGELTPQK
jgi:hypothetical protein